MTPSVCVGNSILSLDAFRLRPAGADNFQTTARGMLSLIRRTRAPAVRVDFAPVDDGSPETKTRPASPSLLERHDRGGRSSLLPARSHRRARQGRAGRPQRGWSAGRPFGQAGGDGCLPPADRPGPGQNHGGKTAGWHHRTVTAAATGRYGQAALTRAASCCPLVPVMSATMIRPSG